jgi:hypothetical protein
VNGTRRIRASSGPPAAICHTFVVAVFAAVPDPSVPAAPGKYAPRATLGWRPSRRPAKDILPAFESNKKDEAAFIAIAALLVAFPRRGFLTRGLTTLIRVYWSFHNFTYNSGNGKHRVTASGSWKPPGTSFSSIKRHYLPTALSLSLSISALVLFLRPYASPRFYTAELISIILCCLLVCISNCVTKLLSLKYEAPSCFPLLFRQTALHIQ